jgi:osmotically-inducible protein OsmY
MKSRITSLGLPAALLSVSLFAACQNTARGVEQDAEKNTAEARKEGREAGQAMERAADRAAQESKDATHSVGATLDAAAQTMQIKTALIDADNLDANDIDVDTNGTTKTVTLKGHVPTAAQKAAAERIAKEKAPEYTVVNQIEVRGK